MSLQAKRELLLQVAPRYREAGHVQKSVILDEFVAATGYDRKYAIRLLSGPMPAPGPIKRQRSRRYGREVQDALAIAWAAANYICAKRLVPFLPKLVKSLEEHGHLDLTDESRSQLLSISPATADRILRALRKTDRSHGVSTTKSGTLLKHQIPVRTFSDWNDAKPGFLEADLVAHCGTSASGSFLYTLVLTDVATGWTECAALRYRGQASVIQALDRMRVLVPFPILGLDTDNGSEFINNDLIAYCGREGVTFTRGRAYKKNDQCFVEQKNGSIVRQIVGYDRFEGEAAYRQLAELYRALRLYVNFFQPSMKLKLKHREGSKAQRWYDTAKTPFERLTMAGVLAETSRDHLVKLNEVMDPVRLLHQIQALQDALWRHAIPWPTGMVAADSEKAVLIPVERPLSFNPVACVPAGSDLFQDDEARMIPPTPATASEGRGRKRHQSKRSQGPRTYRTRPDPFEAARDELREWMLAEPERTAKSLLEELQRRFPGQYPDHLLRTLQRRVKTWRVTIILAFDDQLLKDDLRNGELLPTALRGVILPTDPEQTPLFP